MNHELFIAYRIISSSSKDGSINRGTRIILRVAILGICLGLAVMMIAISTVTGFQKEIRSKVVGFGSHIQISEFNFDNPLNFMPISQDQPFYPNIEGIPEVRKVQSFGLKEGIVKTKDEIHGVIAKGVTTDFDWEFFKRNLESGNALDLSGEKSSKEVLISRNIADKLKLNVGDKLMIYFIQDGKSRPRKLTISGIYNTGLEQFDKAYVLLDLRHIQKINDWEDDEISGFEVLLHDYKDLFRLDQFLYTHIPPELNTMSIVKQYPEIFGWLELQDMNVIVILILMGLVCGINMISALFILILEKTNFIGIMKAMGADDLSIRKVFLYMAAYLVVWGIFWGNLLGMSFMFLQKNFKLIKLDQSSYYIDHVPINIDWAHILSLNFGTLIFCVIFLILPSYIITNISPVKAIEFN